MPRKETVFFLKLVLYSLLFMTLCASQFARADVSIPPAGSVILNGDTLVVYTSDSRAITWSGTADHFIVEWLDAVTLKTVSKSPALTANSWSSTPPRGGLFVLRITGCPDAACAAPFVSVSNLGSNMLTGRPEYIWAVPPPPTGGSAQ